MQDDGAGHLASAGPARQLTLLFLYNALVARLAAAAGAPKLSALLLPLVASECPHLQCVPHFMCFALKEFPNVTPMEIWHEE